jgi:hypothetical protein
MTKKRKSDGRCAIPGCPNKHSQGAFVGDFCAPCYNYLVGTSPGSPRNPSQAWKNEQVKTNFRFISSMRDKNYVGHEGARERLLVEAIHHVLGATVDLSLMKSLSKELLIRCVSRSTNRAVN